MLNVVRIILLCASLLSCATTTQNNQQYLGSNEIYPAIVNVLLNNNIELKKIDIIKNEFKSGFVYQSNFGAKIRYIVVIKYFNAYLNVKLSNIQQYSIKQNQWLDEDRLLFFDENMLVNNIADQIYNLLSNQKRYDSIKREVYNDFQFHFLVMRNLPKTRVNQWIKNNMLGRTFELQVSLNQFKKNSTAILRNKQFIAEFSSSKESNSNELLLINYFTNDKTLSDNTNSSITISGKLVESIDIEDNLLKASNIYLIED
ncbi:hypothetical protein MNBD_GAMMA22-1096 [hydrothermal vent metagenome]|uniref:Lipoprotein n=1 Tax=hydrothermal vent metagenome TaxID=652676 RepID=A0A3B1A2P8_9ZZZZ